MESQISKLFLMALYFSTMPLQDLNSFPPSIKQAFLMDCTLMFAFESELFKLFTYYWSACIYFFIRESYSYPTLLTTEFLNFSIQSSTNINIYFRISSIFPLLYLRMPSTSMHFGWFYYLIMKLTISFSFVFMSCFSCLRVVMVGNVPFSLWIPMCSPMHSEQSSQTQSEHMCLMSSWVWMEQWLLMRFCCGWRSGGRLEGRKEREEREWEREWLQAGWYFLWRKFMLSMGGQRYKFKHRHEQNVMDGMIQHLRACLYIFIMTNFNTYDYQFLIKFLVEGSVGFKAQSVRRLTTLAQNDKKQFLSNSKNVLSTLEELYLEEKDDLNILTTFLLSEIILNVISKENQHIIKSKHLKHVICNLGHPTKPQIRKASHTCLLAFIKTYHNFDGLISEYIDAGFQNDSTLIRQKSINSFQSIFMLEARYFNWKSEQSLRLLQHLIIKTGEENVQIAKAAAQCLLSLCRTEGIKTSANLISIGYLQKLKEFMLNTVSKLPNPECEIKAEDIDLIIQKLRKKPKEEQVKEVEEKEKNEEEKKEVKNIDPPVQNPYERRLEKIKKAIQIQQKKQKQVNLNLGKMLSNLNNETALKERIQAAQDLLYKIQTNKAKPEFQGQSKIILPNIIKMMRDPNPKIVGISLRILENILDDLKSSEGQVANLISVVIEKLGDQKISIRQMVAKVIKELIKKTEKGIWIRELLQNIRKNTNTFLKDQTLAIIHTIYEEYDFQKIDFPVEELLRKIVVLVDDPKTKVKIRTLDCLSQIAFKSNEVERYSSMLKGQMPDVFYQMFIEKVTKLVKEKERKMAFQLQKQKREQISNYRTTYQEKIHSRKQTDPEDKLNISVDVVKKRITQFRKHRNIMSTQETSSLENTQRTIDRNIEDVEIMLPSLYKKSKTNRFELKKNQQISPLKTLENKASDYLVKEDLKPLSDPEGQFKSILSDLKSMDWKVQFETTNTLRRLVEYHSKILTSTTATNLHMIIIDLLGLIESLRSSVSKNALICLHELIVGLGKLIDPEIQVVLEKLMKKSADTNIFISSEVQKCLNALALNATPSKVLDKLSVYKQSKSNSLKEAMINTLAAMKNNEKTLSKEYAKLCEHFVSFLNEGQQDLRTKAKANLTEICKHLGDWYRMLRGKVQASSFKQICDLMTKTEKIIPSATITHDLSPVKERKQRILGSELRTISVDSTMQTNQRINTARTEAKTGQKKYFVKVSQFPQQFNEMQSYIDMSSSSQWKKRIQATKNMKKLALQYPHQFVQFRSSCHFIDILSKQINEPNQRVTLNAMEILLQLYKIIRPLIENNLSVLTSSIFNCLSSQKVEVKEMGQKCTKLLISQIEIPLILPHLCQGIQYSLPKSRVVLLNRLEDLIDPIYKQRKQLLYKYVFPLLNKLMDEYKTELMPHVVNIFSHMYEIMGNNMFSHITKFKEVRELIAK